VKKQNKKECMKKVMVVLPIYDGLDETQRCVNSTLASLSAQRNTIKLILINDASPNATLTEWLRTVVAEFDSKKAFDVQLIENATNKGFVATVNIGMKLNNEDDIILLNSDTEVSSDWVDRLVDAAYSDDSIATVTPFSNNAEICSFPKICEDNAFPLGLSAADIDKSMAALQGGNVVDMPTGVGFCMYIRRDALSQVGYFDEETYGRGYGEENDFCVKASRCGWRNVLCTNVFVFHEGGVSFSDEKLGRIQDAIKIIDRLYPDYNGQVHEHIQQNPAKAHRLLALSQLYRDSDRPTVLHITHELGGGTARHVNELCDYNKGALNTLVLHKGPNDTVVLFFENLLGETVEFELNEGDQLTRLLKWLNVGYLHIHHVMGLPAMVFHLIETLALPYDITLHDYYFINANPTLTNEQGRFCDDLATRDALCAIANPIPDNMPAEAWRVAQGKMLAAANRVISPSQYTKETHAIYFPNLPYYVASHPDWELGGVYPEVKSTPCGEGEKIRVLSIGALSREKGGETIENVAQLASKHDFEFHLLGYAYKPLGQPVIEHGAYRDEALLSLIDEIDPHVIWFPCQCPETYCYTLSAAFRSGRPVIATNLGSFPERIADRPCSWIKDWKMTPEAWTDFFEEDIKPFVSTPQTAAWPLQTACNNENLFYRFRYLQGIEKRSKPLVAQASKNTENIALDFFENQLNRSLQGKPQIDLGKKERVLRLLMRLRSHPMMAGIVRLIPFNVQRSVKRRLSSRPLHEVIHQPKD